ncbi:hypothetical protein VMCG_04940 [Cytospora schulzeri]|uniref:Uncharacterized protein n=1 Tax=Cytospora schulzeri TaxID=448051 RepID=A0A423WMF7_9PEZI|nr:hypothetical protein VMCG_04940 [Valsa malicola]
MAGMNDYPPGFPVPAKYYNVNSFEEYGIDIDLPGYTSEDDSRDDDRTRDLKSLYPYEFLDPNATKPDPQNIPELAGELRMEMVDKMQQDGESGDWTLVEFVPAWTDPDWGDRFVYTGSAQSNDPQDRIYMKPGLLQKQRPALLPADITTRGPTEAAKRYGIDPARQGDPFYSHSGITPTTANFGIQLGYARVTPSNQGEKDMVDMDDLTALAAQFETSARARGEEATDEAFRTHLEDVAGGKPSDLVPVDTEIAAAILALMEQVYQQEEKEEYQRLLFAGNTSNELVRNEVWTIGMNALADLDTPLHELVTQDKWEITDMRSDFDPATGIHTDARTVYNICGQQGEYCMSNDLIRAALQPTLQLVSKVLYSDHPATWAWADIYRLRPVRGPMEPDKSYKTRCITEEHRRNGIFQQEHFAVWLGDYDPSYWYPEIEELAYSGFDSVAYTCEILKRTIQWEIRSKFYGDEDDKPGSSENMGFTQIIYQGDDSLPFITRIGISADYIWPLLVPDYSAAEKAACSFTLAATMLHELSASQPKLLGLERPLLRDVLDNLITFGERVLREPKYLNAPLFYTEEEDYFQGEMKNEEGFATENQYFGGAAVPISSNKRTRFLDDLTIMGCLEIWPHFSGTRIMPNTQQAIPRHMLLKFFSEHFWTHDMVKWGHQAMKIWPQDAPRMLTNWNDFSWALVEKKFGRPARRWMREARTRTLHDDEYRLLWDWLYYLTVTSVEPMTMLIRWRRNQRSWIGTDKTLWEARDDCSSKAAAAQTYLRQLLDEILAWDGVSPLQAPQIGTIRGCMSAMQNIYRILSIEVTYYQTLTVDFHRQSDQNLKNTVQQLLGESVYTRLSQIHMRIATDCIQFLDSLSNLDARVLDRLATIPQLLELLTTSRESLRANFVAVAQLLLPVLRTFGPDRVLYVYNRADFPGVASGNAMDLAKRIQKMALRQLRRLAGPARNVADGWLYLLHEGDKLRNAAQGSEEEVYNNAMDSVADFIGQVTAAQEQSVAAQYPAQPPQQVQEPVLQANQARADETLRGQRFVTSPPGQSPNTWQTIFAEVCGYIPYDDLKTGFTRFRKVEIPNESTAQPELAARALIQGRALVDSLTASGIAAPSFPGVDMPNIGGQMTNQQVAALAGLVGLVRMRAANNPFTPAAQQAGAPAPGAQASGLTAQQAQAIRDLGNLIQARAAQVHANPELAGRVVPAAFGQGLQEIAGTNGENLANTDVPERSNLIKEANRAQELMPHLGALHGECLRGAVNE